MDDHSQAVETAIVVYENDGDNSFTETYRAQWPPWTVQDFEVLDDLDGDGWDEILVTTVGHGYAYEAIGDDAYEQTWSVDVVYTDGQVVNANALADAGDLDGDGRREFLLGGRKTAGGAPVGSVLLLFEAVSTRSRPWRPLSAPSDPRASRRSMWSTSTVMAHGRS